MPVSILNRHVSAASTQPDGVAAAEWPRCTRAAIGPHGSMSDHQPATRPARTPCAATRLSGGTQGAPPSRTEAASSTPALRTAPAPNSPLPAQGEPILAFDCLFFTHSSKHPVRPQTMPTAAAQANSATAPITVQTTPRQLLPPHSSTQSISIDSQVSWDQHTASRWQTQLERRWQRQLTVQRGHGVSGNSAAHTLPRQPWN
jgi:hypothetical protein